MLLSHIGLLPPYYLPDPLLLCLTALLVDFVFQSSFQFRLFQAVCVCAVRVSVGEPLSSSYTPNEPLVFSVCYCVELLLMG